MKERIAELIYEALRSHCGRGTPWFRLSTEQREHVIAAMRSRADGLFAEIVPPPLPEGPGKPPVGP